MKRLALLLLLVASPAFAQSPLTVTLPPEVSGKSGGFIVVKAETQGTIVRWVPLDIDEKTGQPFVSMIPTDLLRDTKTAVCMAPKGRWRLLAYSAVNNEPSEPAFTILVVDGATKPPVTPPPVDPPPVTGGLYFLVVRSDGPADPAFTAIMSDGAWQELKAKGHVYKQKTFPEAVALGAKFLPGTKLPCVVTLRLSADGTRHIQVRDAIPVPTTPDQIRSLPNGVPK